MRLAGRQDDALALHEEALFPGDGDRRLAVQDEYEGILRGGMLTEAFPFAILTVPALLSTMVRLTTEPGWYSTSEDRLAFSPGLSRFLFSFGSGTMALRLNSHRLKECLRVTRKLPKILEALPLLHEAHHHLDVCR